jgi:hypothetical protein
MANDGMANFSLNRGNFIQWLRGEFTGKYCDVQAILAAVQGLISPDDYARMEQILLDSCPAQLNFEESLNNKIEMINRRNSRSFNKHLDLVIKTVNMEDCYSHLFSMDKDICHWSPCCCHTTQIMVIRLGKSDHFCWDGSITKEPTDIVMNQVMLTTGKALITFDHIRMQLYIDIYNTRISYPKLFILLAMADIKACFHFGQIHADLTGAFGFLAGGYFNLATAMVFRLTTSASSWEPFC